MSHSHTHSHHGHSHNHGIDSYAVADRAFIAGITLNMLFVMAEAICGFLFGSLALMTDAGHNLSDVGSLCLGLFAARMARKKPTDRYTYGLRKTTVFASLLNSVVLLVAVGGIGFAAIQRFNQPLELPGLRIAVVAVAGIIINASSALFFLKGKEGDLNMKSAYVHLMADALVSFGVVISGVAIYFTGWYWLDSAVSLGIAAVILITTWGLLRESVHLSLDGVPEGLEITDVKRYLMSLNSVQDVHDLHIWPLSTTEIALTAHIVMPALSDNKFIEEVNHELLHRFKISHSTLQVELSAGDCEQRC